MAYILQYWMALLGKNTQQTVFINQLKESAAILTLFLTNNLTMNQGVLFHQYLVVDLSYI